MALLALLALMFFLPHLAVAGQVVKTAYVFDGPTICDGCSDPFEQALKARGYNVKTLESFDQVPAALASHPAIFVIPGGEDAHVRKHNWNPAVRAAIKEYVFQGGTYVGVCLGAYWAADWPGRMYRGHGQFHALEMVPAHVEAHTPGDLRSKYIQVQWRGRNRQVFYQDGPEFSLTSGAQVEVLATYGSMNRATPGKIAALASRYGNGRVLLSGVHVEADKSWADGLRYHETSDLFREFVDMATTPVTDNAEGARAGEFSTSAR